MNFWAKIDTPLDFIVIVAAVFVVFVNGSTDAPNAIFSVVSSGKLKLWQGALISGIFNFLGVFFSSILGGRVLKSVMGFSALNGEKENAIICLACFLTVIIFGLVTMIFGMPSSESHALMFSLLGASFASGKGLGSVFTSAALVVFYMTFSCVISYFSTLIIAKLLKHKHIPHKRLLIPSCALVSLMHGAQDGQKFVALLLILLGYESQSYASFSSIPVILLVSLVMSLSTLLGGGKILHSMSKISNKGSYSGALFSDLGSFLSLLFCSLLGLPVSTGNIKAFSIFAIARLEKAENKKMISKIFITSLITLPVCFILGALIYFTLWHIF